MLPLNTTDCPLFSIHNYLIQADYNKTLHRVAEELGSPNPAICAGTALVLVGLVGLLFGARLVRPTLVVLCALSGAFSVQALLFNIGALCSATPCLVGALAIALAALVSALLGLFLLNFAFFVGGAAVGVGLVAAFFSFFPSLDVSLGGPVVDGHGLAPYWTAAVLAAVALGLLLMRKKNEDRILIVITAFVSAFVLTSGAQMINASLGGPTVPPQAAAGAALALFVLGAAFQAWRYKKGKKVAPGTYLPYTSSNTQERLLRP